MTDTTSGTVEVPAAGTYRLDASRSALSFTTRHFFGLGPVRGTFRIREGRLTVADPVASSSVLATIDAASIDTGNSARDRTVRSGQYLETDRHADITFASTGLEQSGGQWVLHGTLTVRGTSGPLDVQVESAEVQGPRLRLRATSRVDRYAFGVTAMKGMTGRYLDLRLEVVAERV
ncbi:polyisoprenoid-binding protein YceI [Amycolatopsis endophytica]|uniref:Polyisoprenoid-binding protein YceI n=1 Tax=Amycolatopsis endophytica TaxID=860233 RepID=A0A853BCU3_9PSEU|nr:YceI family protein [Amycolatopsis endophytica]NYI92574.1 polyisoprenoid-binding protein YceI [Amycolatopsis endophytica]